MPKANRDRKHQHSVQSTVAPPTLKRVGEADQADELPARLRRREFEGLLRPLHVELVKVQRWVQHAGLRVVVVFEGRDAAGKGGAIKAITERVSPRVFRVVALPAPSESERSQIYFQRYVAHLPAAGQIVLFDRSWYNRAGVERVMGFCSDQEYEAFLEDCPLIERMIVRDGVILIKYWFEVGDQKQSQRFAERINDQRKTWKLSPMDLESLRRWYDYSRARDAMFAATDTDYAPWYVVAADDARRARLNCIAHLLSKIPCGEVAREVVELPKRQARDGYVEPEWRRNVVPQVY